MINVPSKLHTCMAAQLSKHAHTLATWLHLASLVMTLSMH